MLHLESDVRKAIQSLVKCGIHGAEHPDFEIFLVDTELILSIHLERFPDWKSGSIEKADLW